MVTAEAIAVNIPTDALNLCCPKKASVVVSISFSAMARHIFFVLRIIGNNGLVYFCPSTS